jgi:hypothetical protein
LIRLASGRLFFVADAINRKGTGNKEAGAFVALSNDDGETWTERPLPANITTVGYTTATQGPNGLIHIVTSKNQPDLHIELNEAWVLEGGPEAPPALSAKEVREYREKLSVWSGGASSDGRWRLEGQQLFTYPNGKTQWEATFRAGKKTGVETSWNEAGQKLWEKTYAGNGSWTWRLFDADGKLITESKWKEKDLVAP